MFFFRVTLANFDDEKKVFFMFPDQQALDENGIPPFSEANLCSHQIFKKYVKDTKTSIVDVSYVLFKTTANVSNDLNDEQFEQLKKDNKLSEIDNNDISIITNKKNSSGKKSNNTPFYIVFAGMALLIIALLVLSMKTSTNKEQNTSSTSNISETSSSIIEEMSSSEISSLQGG